MTEYFEYQPAYNNFIKGLSPKKIVVSLPSIIEFDGESHRGSKILGLSAHKTANLEVVSVLSRSIKYKITWDKDKEKEILVFCPTNKSPEEFLYELDHKVSVEVASVYTNDELKDLEKQARKKLGDSIKSAIAKGEVKITKL